MSSLHGWLNWSLGLKVVAPWGDGLGDALDLLEEVLVLVAGEALALGSVEEDVVHPEGAACVVELGLVCEFDDDLDLVVLEGDEGGGLALVLAEPEGVEGHAHLLLATRFFNRHLRENGALVARRAELHVRLHVMARLLVDVGAAHLDAHRIDEIKGRVICRSTARRRYVKLEPRAVEEVAVARDRRDPAVRGHGAVEGLLDGLPGKVGVAAVLRLPVGDLRVLGEDGVLASGGDEAYESAGHDSIFVWWLLYSHTFFSAGPLSRTTRVDSIVTREEMGLGAPRLLLR